MYSDDGGVTWRGAGVDGQLTGTLADTFVGAPTEEFSGTREVYNDPMAIVPYGDHVAAIWANKTWDWSFFDGKSWSKQQPIPTGFLGRNKPFPKFISAVSRGKEIFISTNPGLIVWDGTGWKDDPTVKGAILTVCGDRFVGFSPSESGKELLFWQRTADGKWESREIAREDQPIALTGYRRIIPFIATPRVSPPNFAPVAWTCPKQTWVKVLRVPVE
jgi:hypothetical protein